MTNINYFKENLTFLVIGETDSLSTSGL